jgi:hypothetical protein
MATISAEPAVVDQLLKDLSHRPEEVGFLFAEHEQATRNFRAHTWRLAEKHELASRSDRHLVLTDEARAAVIRLAWTTGMAVIEAHSHGPDGFVRFSGSDLAGFEEWVPHLRWRLRGRPYAAVVIAGDGVDALAWIDSATSPEAISSIGVTGDRPIVPTGETIELLRRRNGHGR